MNKLKFTSYNNGTFELEYGINNSRRYANVAHYKVFDTYYNPDDVGIRKLSYEEKKQLVIID